MYANKKELPTPKPDPPRRFAPFSIFEISICLLAILACVSTIKYVDSITWHEEKDVRYHYFKMDFACSQRPLE